MPARPELERGERLRVRVRELAWEIAGWPSHRSDPPPHEAFTAAYARLSEEIAEEARKEERARCLEDIENGCGGIDDDGRPCDAVLKIQQRSRPSPREPEAKESQ